MKKNLFILSLTLITLQSLPSAQVLTYADEKNVDNIVITKSVQEDLDSFNFDYEKFIIDPEKVLEPIIVNFVESTSNDYCDLLYVYDPNDDFVLNSVVFDYSVGPSSTSLKIINTNITEDLYYTGTSDDGLIDRYAFYSYEPGRMDYFVRNYKIKYINYNDSKVMDEYQEFCFCNSSFDSSTRFMVEFEDAAFWSWYFDEDTWDENFWESFSAFFGNANDSNRLEYFYSFYIDNWDVSDIFEIRLRYSKSYMTGYRAQINDNGKNYESHYQEYDENFGPRFFVDSEKKGCDIQAPNIHSALEWIVETINLLSIMKPNNNIFDFDEYDINYYINLFSDLYYSFSPKEYVITPEEKHSEGVGFSYDWNTIQSYDSLANAFPDTDFINGARTHLKDENKKYWLINFFSGIYTFEERSVNQSESDKFLTYMLTNRGKFSDQYVSFDGPMMCPYYFEQDYIFDVQALRLKFEDAKTGIRYDLPVSVQKLFESEGVSGINPGINSPLPLPEADEVPFWMIALAIILGVLIILVLWPYIGPILTPIFTALIKGIKVIFRSIKKFFRSLKNDKK